MLNIVEVDRLAKKAASRALKRVGVERVFSSPTVASDGADALSVTIVLRGGGATGREAVDAIVGIGQDLLKSGENRLPIISFTTEIEERDARDDPES